jgi:hypothetical protein
MARKSNGNGKGSAHIDTGPWTSDEMYALWILKMGDVSYADIADSLTKMHPRGRVYSANSCQKKHGQTNWDEFFERRDQMRVVLADEDEKERIVEKTVLNHNRLMRREQTKTDIIIDGIRSGITRAPKPKALPISPKKTKSHRYSPESVGLIFSDTHVGASYSMDDTGGLSEYNLSIFKRRMQSLTRGVIEIIERHRNMYDLPELHLFCLGDIVAGMNEAGHWSPNYIDLDVYDQMAEGVTELRDFIRALSAIFPKVYVYGLTGNHGRIGKPGQQKESTNWDRIAYTMVQLMLEQCDNIVWQIPVAWWYLADIQGHSFYLTHGDGIRSSQGIPWYGLEKAQANINGLMPKKPNFTLFGHFHSPAEIQTNSGRIIVNGSFLGGDMYSIKDLRRCDRPEQKIFGIHKNKGITWTYNIYLD